MVTKITKVTAQNDDAKPIGLPWGYKVRRSLAQGLEAASTFRMGLEVADYSTATDAVIGVLPRDAKIISAKFYQDANSATAGAIDIDIGGTSALSAPVGLAATGDAQVTTATLGTTTEFSEDAVVTVQFDTAPSAVGGYIEVTFAAVVDDYTSIV